MKKTADVFWAGLLFLKRNPKLLLLHIFGWAPSLMLLWVFVAWKDDFLKSICYMVYMGDGFSASWPVDCPMGFLDYDFVDVVSFMGRMTAVLLVVFILQVIIATFISTISVNFIRQGYFRSGVTSLERAIENISGKKYVELFKAKILIFFIGITVCFISAVLFVVSLVSFGSAAFFCPSPLPS